MSSSSAVHSNAFNFLSYVQTGVDPRTGQYTISLSLPEVKSHALAGPVLPLSLAFNPMNTRDGGFGLGWSLNLTEFAPQTLFIALGTGETFKVDALAETMTMEEKKLDSFHLHQLAPDLYRVVHRSGLVEILRADTIDNKTLALPEQVLGPDGRALQLSYVVFRGTRRLERVTDGGTVLLQVLRDEVASQVELLFYPGQGPNGGPMARFVLELNADDRVTRLVLPTEEQACWKLEYETIRGIGCLTGVWTPTGGHETITYGDRGDTGHAFPGVPRPALPRVTTHVVEPGFDQPPMEVRYRYTANTNFLGLGALDSWLDDGMDNLYRVADITFTYGSFMELWTDGEQRREVQRTYNRFHLLTEEATTQGNKRKRVVTTYHAEDEDNLYKPFKEQPPYCQMPLRMETFWELTDDSTRQRREVAETWFDDHGNLIQKNNADGTREEMTYYEVAGEPGLCPKDPENFKRHLRASTTYPAAAEHGSAPILHTEHAYVALDPLPGPHNRPFVMEQAQTLSEGPEGTRTELKRVETEYFDNPADSLLHGRTKVITETMNGLPTTTDHQYATVVSPRANAHVLRVVETVTGFDGMHRAITQEHSLLNGEPLLVQDDNGVEIRYAYDALGRVVQETVAPDTVYTATRTYAYHLVGGTGDAQAWQQMSDVKQVHTRTWFDGAARAVKEERQDVDVEEERGGDPRDAPYRVTYRAKYNGLGELVEETNIDWEAKLDRNLVGTYTYDDWGERARTVRPDKVTERTDIDPISTPDAPGPIHRTWLEDTGGIAGGVLETWLDAFDEPVLTRRYDTGNVLVSEETRHRDGLGRLVEHVDARNRITAYVYDAFDRSVQTTLPPGNAVVTRSYALHSSEDLPVSIAVNGVLLGTQDFDGLDRRTEATTGGRLRTFEFDGSKARPSRVVTPAERTIHYEYYEQLGEEVKSRTVDDQAASYGYDPKNSRLTDCSELGIGLLREYYSNGELRKETRTYVGEDDEVADYRYSLGGRLLGCTMFDSEQVITYDAAARVHTTELDATRVTFSYDTFGRVESWVSSNLSEGSSLTITLGYDDFGREVSRTFNENGHERVLAQTYFADDALATRVLTENAVVLRDEGFHYDPRGRLLRHTCAGTELPQDAYGKTYTQQVFTSDVLDNLTKVITSWGGGGADSTDTAVFHYDGDDPVQLTGITHSHADYPAQITLAYDADGNLTVDEQGRTLDYDALGRLTDVGALGTLAAATYRFDALDVLAERSSGGSSERRYYVDGTLTARVEDGQRSRYLSADGHLLAEHVTGTDAGTVLLATDRSNTVLGEVRPGAEQHVAYTAYGFPGRRALWTDVGWNGQLQESSTGWQLLGNGYRAFNPVLMRFHSADDLSPFARGGLNAYAYCGNDPVNLVDPTGHHWGLVLAGMVVGGGLIAGSFQVKDNPNLRLAMQIAGGAIAAVALGYGAKLLKGKMKSDDPSKRSDAAWIQQGRADEAASPLPPHNPGMAGAVDVNPLAVPSNPVPSTGTLPQPPGSPTDWVRTVEKHMPRVKGALPSKGMTNRSTDIAERGFIQSAPVKNHMKAPKPPAGRSRTPLTQANVEARSGASVRGPITKSAGTLKRDVEAWQRSVTQP